MLRRRATVCTATSAGSAPGPGAASVYSTGTTVSPSNSLGTGAPVMIRTAVPGSGLRARPPAATSPVTASVTGAASFSTVTSSASMAGRSAEFIR